jgi:hypothetical protein
MYKLIEYLYVLAFIVTILAGLATLTFLIQPSFNLGLTVQSLLATVGSGLFTKVLGEIK